MKIYISGKRNGMNSFRSKLLFCNAQRYLEGKGHEVINPWKYQYIQDVVDLGGDSTTILLECLNVLGTCDAIYMLANFMESKEAKAEYAFAIACGIKVYYCKELYDNGTLRRKGTEDVL